MLAESVNELWDLRGRGQTAERIALALGWSASAVKLHIRQHGGIRPRVRQRLGVLSFEERIVIQGLRRHHVGVRAIARELGRDPGTISRELKRNSFLDGRYRATTAQARTYVRARRPKPSKLATNPELRRRVQADLDAKYSPEQISGRLKHDFPNRPEMHVSHETIYQAIYLLARGGLKQELVKKLRTGRVLRHPARQPVQRRGRLKDMVNIAERPAEAADRAVPGHWEGDLIIGKNNKSAIGTVVERHSNYLMLIWMDPTKDRVTALTDALTKKLKTLPDRLRQTITWDQGREMANHKTIAIDAGIDVFFCDPHSPWQRPTNENTNGLLRQYFPKGTDLSIYTQQDLDYVEWEMNDRPRKRLNYAKPAEIIENILLH